MTIRMRDLCAIDRRRVTNDARAMRNLVRRELDFLDYFSEEEAVEVADEVEGAVRRVFLRTMEQARNGVV